MQNIHLAFRSDRGTSSCLPRGDDEQNTTERPRRSTPDTLRRRSLAFLRCKLLRECADGPRYSRGVPLAPPPSGSLAPTARPQGDNASPLAGEPACLSPSSCACCFANDNLSYGVFCKAAGGKRRNVLWNMCSYSRICTKARRRRALGLLSLFVSAWHFLLFPVRALRPRSKRALPAAAVARFSLTFAPQVHLILLARQQSKRPAIPASCTLGKAPQSLSDRRRRRRRACRGEEASPPGHRSLQHGADVLGVHARDVPDGRREAQRRLEIRRHPWTHEDAVQLGSAFASRHKAATQHQMDSGTTGRGAPPNRAWQGHHPLAVRGEQRIRAEPRLPQNLAVTLHSLCNKEAAGGNRHK